jgi:glycosyltransferase involved in cell wall biosynthesis
VSKYLSVIIPTHNRVAILRQALACLEAQLLPADMFEVIVVDDASGDDTDIFLHSYKPGFSFSHFRQEKCGGPAIARNRGILAAEGAVSVILNDDALLAPDALAVHHAVHKSLAGQRVSVLGRFDLPGEFCSTLWGYMLQNSDMLFRYQALDHNGLYGQGCWWSCNISTPRLVLLEAGMFDEDFTDGAWGAEDQELGCRLLQLSPPVPVLYREDCRATHMHCLTVEGFERMSLARGGGGALLFAKHNMSCHYSGRITEEDVAYWRNVPARLRRAVDLFHDMLRKTETLRLHQSADATPYYCRDDHPVATATAYRLFAMRTRELLEVFSRCTKELADLLLHIERQKLSLEDAAARLYPLCFILRYYHDSVGICATDAIYRLTASASQEKDKKGHGVVKTF